MIGNALDATTWRDIKVDDVTSPCRYCQQPLKDHEGTKCLFEATHYRASYQMYAYRTFQQQFAETSSAGTTYHLAK